MSWKIYRLIIGVACVSLGSFHLAANNMRMGFSCIILGIVNLGIATFYEGDD